MKNLFITILFSIAFGHLYSQCVQCVGTTTTGTSASAIGTNTVASGNSAFASGFGAQATYQYTTAIGFYSFATQTQAVSIGSMVKATFDRAMVLGSGGDYGTDLYLINPYPRSLMIGFSSINPTLFVSESPINAYYDRTGSVGIGNVTEPTAKLHIKADDNEDASLKLETTGEGYFSRLIFTNAHSIEAKNQDHLYFNTAQGKDFVFHQGDIYLDDIQSGIIMKSPNGLCWRGTLNNDGQLTFVQITCPEETSTTVQTSVEPAKLRLYPNPTSGKLIVETNITGNQAALILRSIEGKIVLQEAVSGNRTEVNLNHISSGIYLMQLVQNDKVIADEKVVVE